MPAKSYLDVHVSSSDEARQQVDVADGVQVLCDCLRRHATTPGEAGRKLRHVLCGSLLNLSNVKGRSLKRDAVTATN